MTISCQNGSVANVVMIQMIKDAISIGAITIPCILIYERLSICRIEEQDIENLRSRYLHGEGYSKGQ